MNLRGALNLFGLLMLTLGLLAPGAAASVEIHAHRGGPNAEGQAMFGENSMAAFRNSAEAGYVIEFDLARTADGVIVAMHDDTLGRTTDCEGLVADTSWADLQLCRIDRLGTGDVRLDLEPGDPRLEPVPSLAQIIEMLEETGARANIEVKNAPTPDTELSDAVYSQLAASGLPSSQVIVQNFRPANLANAPALYPGVETSQLTVPLAEELDQMVIDSAAAGGIDWISPLWPVTAAYVDRAQAAGLRVVPWTIDDPAALEAAAGLGVDAVITNDPARADRLIGPGSGPEPEPEPEPEPTPRITLKLTGGKVEARPGGKLRLRARISNAGDGESAPVPLMAMVAPGAPLRFVGKRRTTVPALEPGQSRSVLLKLLVKPGKRKPHTYRVFVVVRINPESEDRPILRQKSLKVRVLRPRR